MSKYFDIPQRSELWDQARLGICTASQADTIITPLGKETSKDKWQRYAHKLIAEKIMKRRVDSSIASSPWIERGELLEGEAVAYYEAQTGKDTNLICFVTTDDGLSGCSPDRLVGTDGLLEIKVPAPHTQIGYFLRGKLEEQYTPQLQMQLYVTGRKYVDILSYSPDFPDHVIITVERHEAFIACLDTLLKRFNDYVHNGVLELAERWKGINRVPDALEDFFSSNDVPEIRNAQTLLAG